jgi:hypothetical protein
VDAAIREHALHEIRTRNLIEKRMFATYEALSLHGPKTGKELDLMLDSEGPHGHVSALNKFGVTKTVGRRLGKSGNYSKLVDVTGTIPDQCITWTKYVKSPKKGKKTTNDANDAVEEALNMGRGFWRKVREDMRAYYSPKVAGLDSMIAEQLLQSLDIDVATFNRMINNRFASVLQNTTGHPWRKKLRGACQALGLNPPGAGKPLDLKLARRKMHKLAQQYHPDVNPRGEEMFRRVVDAFRVIEAYTQDPTGEKNA